MQMWNALEELHAGNFSDGVVLYLPGEWDLDRRHALRKGVRPENLIAVERSAAVTAKLRARGVNCINSNLAAVLESWPSSTPLVSVLADFQGYMSDNIVYCAMAWAVSPALAPRASMLLNIQRGREAAGTAYFQDVRKYFERVDASLLAKVGWDNNNRAYWTSLLLSTEFADLLGLPLLHECWGTKKIALHLPYIMLPSYKSNVVTMDSVVLAPHSKTKGSQKTRWLSADEKIALRSVVYTGKTTPTVRAKISAALAVRTMQKQGRLKVAR